RPDPDGPAPRPASTPGSPCSTRACTALDHDESHLPDGACAAARDWTVIVALLGDPDGDPGGETGTSSGFGGG
ncbi:hypothetical protein, partial [Nonomuraea sp. NPDC049784]|uniref:hypothetical protein n=1 Tax=Nonomuraea sp. NPDC049784 TaxID=3154361 RepID=UPI0033DADC01